MQQSYIDFAASFFILLSFLYVILILELQCMNIKNVNFISNQVTNDTYYVFH